MSVEATEITTAPLARYKGEPILEMPTDLYIPPEALRVLLDAFEGPLDLLLYLIRKHSLDVLDIPMADLTRQYMAYVEIMRENQLELAAEYLLMAAMLTEIKSRMLLPRPAQASEDEDDPCAELIRRLLEYERMKLAAQKLNELPQSGRDFSPAQVWFERTAAEQLPDVNAEDLRTAWLGLARPRPGQPTPSNQSRRTVCPRAHESDIAKTAKFEVRSIRRSFRRQ